LEPPPNILPRISAPTATAIGVARLPPGTAFFIASSKEPIVVSSPEIENTHRCDHRPAPGFEDITARLPACVFRVHTAHSSAGGRRTGGYHMGILSWIILGLIAGFIASKIVNKTGSGMTMDIALGVVGAIVGGFLADLVLGIGVTGVNITSIIISVIGAVLVLWVYHKVVARA
jgi:uncharacterized membrane protein YeaQ/YmgE (transglycosylase-associated protein family)